MKEKSHLKKEMVIFNIFIFIFIIYSKNCIKNKFNKEPFLSLLLSSFHL